MLNNRKKSKDRTKDHDNTDRLPEKPGVRKQLDSEYIYACVRREPEKFCGSGLFIDRK